MASYLGADGVWRTVGASSAGPVEETGGGGLSEAQSALLASFNRSLVDGVQVQDSTLSGLTQNGTTYAAGARVLVTGQEDMTANGVYVASAGAWSRSSEANTAEKIRNTYDWYVVGTGQYWLLETPAQLTELGVSEIEIDQYQPYPLDLQELTSMSEYIFAPGGLASRVSDLDNAIVSLQTQIDALNASAVFETTENKRMPALATVSDYDLACSQAIAATPAGDGYVRVLVNGGGVQLGDGTRAAACYFSGDGGLTARAIGSIEALDTLHWVGSIATYQLAPTDVIEFDYEKAG